MQARSGWIPFEVGVADKLGFDGLVLVEQDGSGRGSGIFNADPLPSVKEIPESRCSVDRMLRVVDERAGSDCKARIGGYD